MRRLAPVLAGMAGATVLFGYAVPVGPLTLLVVLGMSGGLGLLALLAARRTATPEPGWSGPSRSLDLGRAAVPAAPRPRVRPPARKVAAALSRVEARDLVGSPWFGAGLGLLLVCYLSLAWVWGAGNGEHWTQVVAVAPWLAHPLVGMIVLAAHRGATRARRDGADELFDTCPVDLTTRTWGFLASAWVPVAVLAAFFVVYGVTLGVRSPDLYGSVGADAVAVVLSALVLGAGGVALGVALGRWAPFALAPLLAVQAIGFVSLRLVTAGDPGWNPLQQLSTAPPISEETSIFGDPPAWSHLGWLLSLTAAVVVVAIARHRRDRTVAVMGAVACLLVAATGVAATRPMPEASAARIAALVSDPAGHQSCRPAAAVPVCTYPGHDELAERIVDEVTPVAAMLPDAALPVTLRQRYPGTIDDLPPEVARRLPGGVPPVPADEVVLGFSASRDLIREAGSLVALRVVGLPQEPDPDNRPLVIAGQARGVVALWLATRGLAPGPARELASSRTPNDLGDREPDAFDRGYAWPDCTAPVVWSAQDLRAARALLALPEETVRAVVHHGWPRWLDPATGTDQLLAEVGVPSVGPFDVFPTKPKSPHC